MNKRIQNKLKHLSTFVLGTSLLVGTPWVLAEDAEELDAPFNMTDYLDFESDNGHMVEADIVLYTKEAATNIQIDEIDIDGDSFAFVGSNCFQQPSEEFCYVTVSYQPVEERVIDEAMLTMVLEGVDYHVDLLGLNLSVLDCEYGLDDEFDDDADDWHEDDDYWEDDEEESDEGEEGEEGTEDEGEEAEDDAEERSLRASRDDDFMEEEDELMFYLCDEHIEMDEGEDYYDFVDELYDLADEILDRALGEDGFDGDEGTDEEGTDDGTDEEGTDEDDAEAEEEDPLGSLGHVSLLLMSLLGLFFLRSQGNRQ